MHDPGLERVVEMLDAKLWGKFRATVVSNDSTDHVGWVQVRVHGVLGERPVWARPNAPFAGPDSGFYCMPDIDSLVWVEFEDGDSRYPVWTGSYWKDGELAEADPGPGRKILRAGSLQIVLDEEAGEIQVENGSSTRLVLRGDEIALEASKITLKSGGKTVELSAGGFDMLSGALKVV